MTRLQRIEGRETKGTKGAPSRRTNELLSLRPGQGIRLQEEPPSRPTFVPRPCPDNCSISGTSQFVFWLLAHADGAVSPTERAWIERAAEALEVGAAELARLDEKARAYLLSHLTHLADTDATARVAKKMGY